MAMVSVLAVNAAISALVFLGLWRYAVAKQDPSFIDSWWGAGMALLALLTFVQSNRGPHALALTLLGAAWG
ncbi:MAG: DUF1295 domain-containing protein, partial [Phenylobacterium sp.]